MCKAKKYTEDEKFANIKQNKYLNFKLVKQIRKDSIDITGDTYIKDENENLCFTNAAKRQAWQDHYKIY